MHTVDVVSFFTQALYLVLWLSLPPIIVGSVVISNALKEPEKARALTALLRRAVTREVDQKELVGLIEELDQAAEKAGRS